MSISKSRASIAALEPNSRHEQAYAEIRQRILKGDLLPDEPLSEYRLAEQLQLSRTPVREALKRLEFEGLVRFVLNRGAFVAGLSVRDLVEIYQLREQLESFAARIAATETSNKRSNPTYIFTRNWFGARRIAGLWPFWRLLTIKCTAFVFCHLKRPGA